MEQFFKYVEVLVGIYVAQTGFKIASTRKNKTFDIHELLNGIVDYAIYFLSVTVFFFAGMLIPDVKIIDIGDKTLNITDALTLLAYGMIIIQAKKCFDNIKETFQVSDEVISKTVMEKPKEIG